MQDTAYEGEVTDNRLLEKAIDAIDDAGKVATSLECLCGAVSTSNKEQGLSSDGSKVLMMTMESLMGAVRIDNPLKNIDMQGFKDPVMAVPTGALVMESLRDGLRLVWEKINQLILNISRTVGELFYRYLTATGRTKARAASLLERAKTLNVSTAIRQTVDMSGRESMFLGLCRDGKFSTDLAHDLAVMVNMLEASYSGACLGLYEKWFIKAKHDLSSAKDVNDVKRTADSLLGTLALAVSKCNLKKVGEDDKFVFYFTGVMLGEYVVRVKLPKSAEDLSGYSVNIGRVTEKAEHLKMVAPVLTRDQSILICKLIEQKAHLDEGALQRVRLQAEALFSSDGTFSVIKRVTDTTDSEQGAGRYLSSLRAASHMVKGLSHYMTIVSNAGFHHSLDYVSISLNAQEKAQMTRDKASPAANGMQHA